MKLLRGNRLNYVCVEDARELGWSRYCNVNMHRGVLLLVDDYVLLLLFVYYDVYYEYD